MESYQRIDNGEPTTANDPKRGVWYSAACSYWTDDWTKLRTDRMGIPCCPKCGCPGLQTEAGSWFSGAMLFEEQGHPFYREFLDTNKEACLGRRAKPLMERYESYVASRERGDN